MLSALNPFRPLELRSGIQVYPPPQQASLERRSSLSVFQLCHSVRSRLLGNPAFARYLHSCAQSPMFDPSDPVNHLWDCFCLGISLCYLYNTVSARSSIIPLTVGTDLSMLEAAADQDRAKKVAIVNFAMRARDLNPAWTTLTVTDLVNNRVSLDGFLKYLYVVDEMLDMLPKEMFGGHVIPKIEINLTNSVPNTRFRLMWRQLIATERSYVKSLERIRKYADTLQQTSRADLVEQLFPMLNQLVDFQRWFCVHVETIATSPSESQHLGLLFVDNEAGFAGIYEPYCTNTTHAADVLLREERNLSTLNFIIDVQAELPALILAPSHRIYSYPIILETMLQGVPDHDIKLRNDLEQGLAAMIRVTNAVNTQQRQATTQTIVENLQKRVQDWRNLDATALGDLLLVDVVWITTSDDYYEAHVFLFHDMALCFWDPSVPDNGTKHTAPDTPLAHSTHASSSLVLRHRFRLSDVIFASSYLRPSDKRHRLVISWRSVECVNPERFELCFPTEARMKEWKDTITQLIDDFGMEVRSLDGVNIPSKAPSSISGINDDWDVPNLSIEPAVDFESLRRKTLSIRSTNTLASAEDHIMSYYFNGLLSPAHAGRDGFSLTSREDSGDYDTTSILAAYERNRTPSPGTSPGSEHKQSSPRQLGDDQALRSSPHLTDEEEKYRQDIVFMQRILRLEDSADALTLQRGPGAIQTLDLIQQVLDRMNSVLRRQSLTEVQATEGQALRQGARRIVLKLAKDADVLPESLFIKGLHIPRIDRAVCLGGFADIYLGSYQNQAVAVKRLRVSDEHKSVNSMLQKEALIWRQLDHPFILQFMGVDRDVFQPYICMVAPWLPHGNVMSYMQREGPNTVQVQHFLFEIAQGMEYLHAEGLIHGDLRGSNILVDNDHHPRLADFGLGSIAESTAGSHTSKGGGSIRWMAPELLRAEGDFQRTLPTDVYSYGCVCVELYTHTRPYADVKSDMHVFYHVVHSGWRPSRPTEAQSHGTLMTDDMWHLTQECWQEDPFWRPTMNGVVSSIRLMLRSSSEKDKGDAA